MLATELLGQPLYTAQQSRDLDRLATDQFGIPGFTLMRRAGKAAFRHLLQRWPQPKRLTVYAGTGNNGGDGFIIASLARQYGLPVEVVLLGEPSRIQGDARLAFDEAVANRVIFRPFQEALPPTEGVIVDAMLGTGLGGQVRGDYAEAIQLINSAGLPVLAVDIPSGLCSDTGQVLGCAVVADLTVTFIGVKRGLLTHQGPDHTGVLHFDAIEVPAALYGLLPASAHVSHPRHLAQLLGRRSRAAHKGDYGHVLIIGGDHGMAGAVSMAAEAAARVGSGLVSVATQPEHVAALVARRPEVMVHGVVSGQELEPLLERPTVIVIGPGLGRRPWADQMLQKALKSCKPLVVDADALNLLAEKRVLKDAHRDNWILTPHPGEAARLLGVDSEAVQADRFAAVSRLQLEYGGVVLLKGAGSLIHDGQSLTLCAAGNPGMASGGMGDVLSGVIAGLLAQGLSVGDAAAQGATVHGMAADLAAGTGGERGILATDLMLPLRRLVNGELG